MQEAPSVVQALSAPPSDEGTTSHQSPSKRKTRSLHSQEKQDNSSSKTPTRSCCTRSQAAPDWTVQEVLVLLSEIASIDEEWFKELSSYQRWKMISDSCMALNVVRSSNQCKRKWEMLLGDYMKIRKWESRSREEDSYWVLVEERREDYGLPVSFQKEVFDAIDAVIQVQQHQSDSNNSDSDHIISVSEFETSNMDTDSETSVQRLSLSVYEEKELITTSKNLEVEELITAFKSPDKALVMEEFSNSKSPEVKELITTSKCPEERPEVEELITTSMNPEMEDLIRTSKSSEVKELITTSKSPEKAVVIAVIEEEELITTPKSSEKTRVMAGKLQENAEHVCAILRGELKDGASNGPPPLDSLKPSAAETEFARRQADDLIKALAGLTNTLDELCECINRGGCAKIVPVDSKA